LITTIFAERHFISALYAPLQLTSRGSVDRSVSFAGASFAPGTPLFATYRFDSYRLTYRYSFVRDDAQTATLLGSAYLGSGDFAKASVHLAKVVEATPEDGTAWFNYGLSLSRSKQFPKAETALVKASTLLSTNAI
jgi:tetratricopeptide (TPR) repeat protein